MIDYRGQSARLATMENIIAKLLFWFSTPWEPDLYRDEMRRWKNGRIERRALTADERAEMVASWSIR